MYRKKTVFVAACIGMLLFGVTLITLGSVAVDLVARFHLNNAASGALFSVLPFGILTGSLLFGPLCDKYGYKYLLVMAALLIAGGIEGIAFTETLLMLKVSIFIFGVGGGAINGATNAVAADISDGGKGARLSLLGVFFGIGALGMPFLLGVLEGTVTPATILAGIGGVAVVAAVFFLSILFPPPKHSTGLPIKQGLSLIKDPLLVLIAFFLFCQSSFEGIINNWTTSYLIERLSITQSRALYALSLYVVGMTAMRLISGGLLKNFSVRSLLVISFVLLVTGCYLINQNSFLLISGGLILTGAGLAGGFPIMLGIVADRYKDLSATAFSVVLAVALLGNMLVNYLMGLITNAYGIGKYTYVIIAEIVVMTILGIVILSREHKNKQQA